MNRETGSNQNTNGEMVDLRIIQVVLNVFQCQLYANYTLYIIMTPFKCFLYIVFDTVNGFEYITLELSKNDRWTIILFGHLRVLFAI